MVTVFLGVLHRFPWLSKVNFLSSSRLSYTNAPSISAYIIPKLFSKINANSVLTNAYSKTVEYTYGKFTQYYCENSLKTSLSRCFTASNRTLISLSITLLLGWGSHLLKNLQALCKVFLSWMSSNPRCIASSYLHFQNFINYSDSH